MLHRHFASNEPPPPNPAHQVNTLGRELSDGTRKAVVYAGTRNLYKDMLSAVKSMLTYNPDVQIYLLIEDDQYPFYMPENVESINVSGQPWFRKTGPNFRSGWSYMILMRAALTKLFPEYDRILSMDVDTLATEDLSCLWEMDMTDMGVAGVPEYEIITRPRDYINVGCMMQNLKLIREKEWDNRMIDMLNRLKLNWPEQDAINTVMKGHIIILPVRYNDSFPCGYTDNPAVIHLCGPDKKNDKRMPMYEAFGKKPWDDILLGKDTGAKGTTYRAGK